MASDLHLQYNLTFNCEINTNINNLKYTYSTT